MSDLRLKLVQILVGYGESDPARPPHTRYTYRMWCRMFYPMSRVVVPLPIPVSPRLGTEIKDCFRTRWFSCTIVNSAAIPDAP
jgi:hypothetical protein